MGGWQWGDWDKVKGCFGGVGLCFILVQLVKSGLDLVVDLLGQVMLIYGWVEDVLIIGLIDFFFVFQLYQEIKCVFGFVFVVFDCCELLFEEGSGQFWLGRKIGVIIGQDQGYLDLYG